jgi:pimeloyl-ACP methyl ester carboxylesterase
MTILAIDDRMVQKLPMGRLFFTRKWAISGLGLLSAGCAGTATIAPQRPDTVVVVPGLGGDGGVYAQVVYALRDAGSRDCLKIFDWGYGWGLFFVTISSDGLHRDTEQRLVEAVAQWRAEHPGSRIVLIGHSAGAGVILGTLARLGGDTTVGQIILLAPAVSPEYDLRPALKHASVIHVFYCRDDIFWEGIGPTIFGGYDGVHGSGAGRLGFSLVHLTEAEKQKVVQHPYQAAWKSLDYDGGHFNSLSAPFIAKVIKPLIDAAPPVSR